MVFSAGDIIILIALIFLGMANGFYSGLMGTGGNVILIPALDFILSNYGIPDSEIVKYIIAHSLFITVFNGLFVSYKQYRIKNFYYKDVLLIGIPAMLIGYYVTEIVKTSTWYHKILFDILFLVLVILLSIRYLFFKQGSIATKLSMQGKIFQKKFHGILLGSFTGLTSALSGFGGGIVLIPSLTDVFKISIQKASSISIGVVMLLAIAVSASYFNAHSLITEPFLPCQYGYISLKVSIPVIFGIFLAAPLGVKMAQKLSANFLRLIFGLVMVFICVKILFSLLQ